MFTTVVALRLQLLEVRVMGFTEEIHPASCSAWAHWGAGGPSMNCDLLRTSTRAVSRPVLEDVVARPRSKRGLSKEQICIMSGVLARLLPLFAPQIINRPLKLKVVKDNNFNYGQWKELPEE